MNLTKKKDIIIIGCILVFALLLWLFYSITAQKSDNLAEIRVHNELIHTIELKNDGNAFEYPIPQNPHVVLKIDGEGGIFFIASDCPDKVCIHYGRQSISGQSAACLPNGVTLTIVPKEHNKDSLDMVV